ncbi:MAG: hypothetical protein GY856_36750 [bacterium]|nr:hypothetical protein [bacterium]
MKITRSRTGIAPKWFPFIEDWEMCIASSACPEFKKACRKVFRSRRTQLDQMSDEQKEALIVKAAAAHLLKDWRGAEDDDGEPIPYTAERGVEIFEDPEYHHVYEFVLTTAGDWQQYLKALEEEAEGN